MRGMIRKAALLLTAGLLCMTLSAWAADWSGLLLWYDAEVGQYYHTDHDCELGDGDLSSVIAWEDLNDGDGRFLSPCPDCHSPERPEETVGAMLPMSAEAAEGLTDVILQAAAVAEGKGVLTAEEAEAVCSASETVYYNPDGGQYYHADRNCGIIKQKYLPLKGEASLAELTEGGLAALLPCEACGAPAHPAADAVLAEAVFEEMSEEMPCTWTVTFSRQGHALACVVIDAESGLAYEAERY